MHTSEMRAAAPLEVYPRLLRFLKPHRGLMVAHRRALNVSAAILDVFSFTLLIPFLNALFGEPPLTNSPAIGKQPARKHGRLVP